MEIAASTCDSVELSPAKSGGHRRQPSALGKTMPVTSLLLNFPPPSMAALRSQDHGDRPPLYFAVPQDDRHYEAVVAAGDDDGHDAPDHCAAISQPSTQPPCLTCTGMAAPALASRDSAINEMCRRLCTDECRMRLSLGGFVPEPPSPVAVERRRGSEKIRQQRARYLQDMLKENAHVGGERGSDDADEVNVVKDFRERNEIAEALAKTSAMTSTTQIKQRLAARKLEFQLDANAAEPEKLGASVEVWGLGTSCGAQAAAAVAAAAAAASSDGETEPPRDLLLYLVRMGSFNSAPKINNMDCQDDGLDIPAGLSSVELLQHVKHLRGLEQPPLLSRYFLKPSMAAQMVSNDITEGLRSLKLNPMTRSSPNGPNSIRLLQWNVLSQSLGQNNDGFVCCPEEALTWDNRKFLIVQEILQHNPDIICLQEVDHFKFLQTILATQNYSGIFFPKPDSPCLYIEENNGPDGCAIFYKSDKFELRHCETRILEVWRVQSNQVAIAANLHMKSNGQELCVCTTHLKARHGALLSKLRNEQGRDLLRFVKACAGERPVLLCGDFNAEPSEPVYSTVLKCDLLGLGSAYADIKRTPGGDANGVESSQAASPPADGNGHCAHGDVAAADAHDALLDSDESSSDDVDGGSGLLGSAVNGGRSDVVQQSAGHEPAYTTWKIREDGEVCHTIDYVFYSKERFRVSNCLEFPPEDDIGKDRTPSFRYPSDHFSLVCDFEMQPLKTQHEQQQQQQKLKNQ